MVTLLVIFLFIYFPFEDWIISRLPFSGSTAVFLKQLPDALLIVTYVYSAIRYRWLTNKTFIFFIFFVIYGLVLCLAYNTGISVFANLKALVRYIPLMFLYPYLRLNIKKMRKVFFYLLWFQLIIALVQFTIPNTATWFKPASNIETELYTSSFQAIKNFHEISGTFSTTIGFCYFILIYYIFFGMSRLTLSISLFAVFLSGSKIIFALLLTLILWDFLKKFPKKIRYFYSTIGAILLIVFFPMYESILEIVVASPEKRSFTEIFTQSYWIKIVDLQRGAIVQYIILPLYATYQIILGYGPSSDNIIPNIKNFGTSLNLDYYAGISEDVYALTFIIYFGIIGTVLFLIFINSFYKRSINSALTYRLLLTILFLSFFNQTLEVKGFSFYFWLLIGNNIFFKKK